MAITLWPFIYIKSEYIDHSVVVNHEKIHLKQQFELPLLVFLIWYGTEWLIRRFQYRSGYEAYLNISFEREAYANQYNPDYLKKRKPYSFLKYIANAEQRLY